MGSSGSRWAISFSCSQNLFAWLVIRLGQGLGLSGDTLCCPSSTSLLCGTGLVSRSQGWGQGEKTFVFAPSGHLRWCPLRRPEQGPSRETVLGLEFSMAHQGTKLRALEPSWGGVGLSRPSPQALLAPPLSPSVSPFWSLLIFSSQGFGKVVTKMQFCM